MRRTTPAVALKVMSVIISLRRRVQWRIILQRIQRGDLESSANERLIIPELVLCITEAFPEQPDFPLGMGEVKVCRRFRAPWSGVGWLRTRTRTRTRICVIAIAIAVVAVGPVVGLQL